MASRMQDGASDADAPTSAGISKTSKRTMDSKTTSGRTLGIVFLSLLIDLLGFTVILPLLPSILEYYSQKEQDGLLGSVLSYVDQFRVLVGGPGSARFNIVLLGGALGSLFSLLQFIMSPLLGALSDIYGRKRILLFSMVGVALSYLLWAVSYNFLLFLLARVLCGLSKGNVSISTSIVTDVTSSEGRSRGMALIGVSFSLGFIFGPTIGALFSILGRSSYVDSFDAFQFPALFALLMATADIAIIAALFKESLPLERRANSLGQGVRGTLHLINPLSLFGFKAVSKISPTDLRSLRQIGLAYFLYLFLFSGLEYSLTFLVHQAFNYTSLQQGRMFLFIGVIMAAVQGGYVRRTPLGKEKATALKGMVAIIPGLVLVGAASTQLLLYFGLALYSFGASTIVPSLTTIVSRFGDGDEKGRVMGIFRSLGALARAFGPFAASTVYWRYGPLLCYSAGGLFLLVPLAILVRAKGDKKEE